MPRRGRNDYGEDWPQIAQSVKDEADWHCVRCGHGHDVPSGHVLTVHHLDLDKSNMAWWNLLALCQRCHLVIQHKVRLEQSFMFEHSEWFKPYVAGWYAWRYLGEEISRKEAEARQDELLALERVF